MSATAIITASYVGDYERCKLLCESIDRHMMGDWTHFLLVTDADVPLFRSLATSSRQVISERDLLPGWLFVCPDPFSVMRRKLWLSPFSIPLRGWHVQQLRRMALARHISEPTMLTLDSDVVLIRDFNPADLWQNGKLALYKKEKAIDAAARSDHLKWLSHSERVLGCALAQLPATDYISSLLPWRTDTCLQMLDHIEALHGRHWVRTMIRTRAFSECILYGRFVDDVLQGAGHYAMPHPLCHSLWSGDSYGRTLAGLESFVADLAPNHVCLQIQSFIGHSIANIRSVTAMA